MAGLSVAGNAERREQAENPLSPTIKFSRIAKPQIGSSLWQPTRPAIAWNLHSAIPSPLCRRCLSELRRSTRHLSSLLCSAEWVYLTVAATAVQLFLRNPTTTFFL